MVDAFSDLLSRFFVKAGSEDLASRFFVRQGSEDLASKFSIRLKSENLGAKFRILVGYDFSDSYGISFYWWGSGRDVNIDLVLRTPTGNFVTSFGDGPAEWRGIFIPWSKFIETGIDGSRPNKACIISILWTVHTPGTWRIDRVSKYRCVSLKAGFVVRREASADLKAGFSSHATLDLKAGFNSQAILNLPCGFQVRYSSSQDLAGRFEIRQGIRNLPARFSIGKGAVDLKGQLFIGEDLLTYTEVDGDTI